MSAGGRAEKAPRAAFGVPGQRVGKFRLEALIGAGGFGEVWRAQEEIEGQPVGDACALKLLWTAPGGSDGRAGWVQEINALKSIESPAIPRTIDGGIDDASGLAFIAMQLLEGETLAKRIAERRLGWRRALAVAASVAEALDAAHARGLVHRDLKPQNVFLGAGDRVYVIDWGIAALAGGAARGTSGGLASGGAALPRVREAGAVANNGEAVANDGETMPSVTAELPLGEQVAAAIRHDSKPRELTGTYGYIAPEGYDGAVPTAATDAYALGVLLYQAIAGRLPHRIEALPSGSGSADAARARAAALVEATIRGHLVALADVAPDVPEGVQRLVNELLSRDPSQRVKGKLADTMALAGSFPYGVPDPPYAGLDAFGVERAALLFGRAAHVQQIVGRLRIERAIVLSGPSGCGKSSLAVAGVATELDRSLARGVDGWRIAVVRPSDAGALALAGAPGASESGRGTPEHAERGRGAPERAEERGRGTAEPCLGTVVVVDQLEEVLALDAPAREAFSAALAALAEGRGDVVVQGRVVHAGPDVRVIATVREDSEWQVAKIDALRALCETNRRLVTGVDPGVAREMVEEPARALGYRVEGIDEVVAEAEKALAADSTALPIVEFALSEWWDRRDKERRVLPAAAWKAIGGIDGALSHVADRFYDSLDGAGQRALGELFRHLMRGERKRPVPLASLSDGALRWLCDELVRFRLVRRHEERDGHVWFELSHESLARRWSVLERWIADAAVEDALIADIEEEARYWARHGRTAAQLRRDAHALKAATGVRARLEEAAQAYVDASVAAVEAAEAAEKQRRWRRRWIAIAVVAGLLLAAAAYVVMLSREQAKTKAALEQVERKEKEARDAAEQASKAKQSALERRAEAEAARREQEALKTKFQSDLADLEEQIAAARGDAEKLKQIAVEVARKRGAAGTAPTAKPSGQRRVDSSVGDPP